MEYYLFTDSSIQGWGAHMHNLTAAGTWTDELSHLHINVLELRAVSVGIQAFCHNWTMQLLLSCPPTHLLLPTSGGTRSHLMSDLAVDINRGMTLVPRHISGHLNMLADHLSRKVQILKTEWSLNQTIVDRVFHL